MTIATPVMLVAFGLAMAVAVVARRLLRWTRGGMIATGVGWGIVNAMIARELCGALSHGSELSNLGDGLVMLAVMLLHVVCWPLAAIVASRRLPS